MMNKFGQICFAANLKFKNVGHVLMSTVFIDFIVELLKGIKKFFQSFDG